MADDTDVYQTSSNFVNPQYASPEQLKNLRDWANQLMTGKGQMPVHRWTQGVSNIVNSLMGGLASGDADKIQSQAAAKNAASTAALIQQLQGGQQPDAGNLGNLSASPMTSPETRAIVQHLITPEATKDVQGRPAYQGPAIGITPAPIHRAPGSAPYEPGNLIPQSAEGVSTVTPSPAPMGLDATSPQGGIFGGMNNRPADWPQRTSPPPAAGGGGQAPAAALPAAAAPATGPLTLDALAAKGREFAAQRAYTQGTAEGQTKIAQGDIDAAATAPTIKRIAGTMLDDINAHGGQMTFGPTAEWSNNVKRIAANYAPGFMKDQIGALASADSVDKLSAQLTGILAKGGGTDAQLFNNMKSVPGAHNSQEGAKALLQMVNQTADQQIALRQATAGAKTAADYETARTNFYKQNPIINPITGNPIQQDLAASKAAPQYEKTAVNPQTKQRIGLVNGKWEPIP